ncbi:MAG: ATP-binding protein [Pseudoruegeria sp.]
MTLTTETDPNPEERTTWRARFAVLLFMAVAISVVWFTNLLLTERYTETTRNTAQVRQALYSGNLLSELRRNAIVPQLLARDPTLIGALNSGDHSQSSQRLITYSEQIDLGSLMLLDQDGRVVASSDRNLIGKNYSSELFYVSAMGSNDTVFSAQRVETGATDFTYSRQMETIGPGIGVIVVGVDLRKFESTWSSISDAVLVTDSEGIVILATEPRWRGRSEADALAQLPAPSAIMRALRATTDWSSLPVEAYLQGDSLMRLETRIPFQGWRMTSFTTYNSVRERVNGFLALEIMGFAMLLALAFYLVSRKAQLRSLIFQQESEKLRDLNQRLQREVSERRRVEKSLEVAEQTLAQSSKLAALGEMSAAVSHELNQPLAAMKTYLAGAKLLMQRKRPDEAVASFQRIDDLIERMGAITKQLKSYARKSGDQLVPVDTRDAVLSAMAMMEPQLRSRHVRITKSIPSEPVMVMADRIRLEQVIINLFRNALDATHGIADPEVEILLSAGETATLSVRDNGVGIDDLDALFEPFYTTKQPGDGVGLGLAISSGIVNDLGGRLTARNGRDQGAVFEVRLPILNEEFEAAE